MSKKPIQSSSSKKDTTLSQQAKLKQQLKTMKKMDCSHLKQQIHHLRSQLKHLYFFFSHFNRINQKIFIQKDMQRRSEQFMTESYQLQKVNKRQQQELVELQGKLHILRNTFGEQRGKKKLQLNQQISQLSAKKQLQKQQLLKTYDQLYNKVTHIKRFKQRETNYNQVIKKLQQRIEYLSQSHNRDITKMKSTFSSKRQQIKQSTNKQIQNIQQSQINRLRQKLTLQKQYEKQNQLMQKQITLCQQQKQIVSNQCRLLNQQIKKNLQQQGKSLLTGQATETYQRSLRVLKLQGKMNKLKQYLSQQTTRLDQQLKSIDKLYDQQQKLCQQKVEKLKTTISLKQRDYKKVKACSQMVLNQRSSLQAYLLQVFYQNPQLSMKNPLTVNQTLRKLFVKINSKKVPVSYKNYVTLSDNINNNNLNNNNIKVNPQQSLDQSSSSLASQIQSSPSSHTQPLSSYYSVSKIKKQKE